MLSTWSNNNWMQNVDLVAALSDILDGAGASGIWLPKEPTLYSDRQRTTEISPGSGSIIGSMSDHSGNDRDLYQVTSGREPLATNGATMDGVDDRLGTSLLSPSSDMSVLIGITTTDTQAIVAYHNSGNFLACWDASTNNSYTAGGSPTVLVDDVSIGTQRVQLRDAINDGSPHRLEYPNINLGTWTSFTVGSGAFGGFQFAGSIQAVILIDNTVLTAQQQTDALTLARQLVDANL